MARRLAEGLISAFPRGVVVENKPGASGNIGAAYVARSRPDGQTLLVTTASLAIAPALFKDLSFDPVKAFTGIAQLALVPLILVVPSASPLNSIADLVALAKSGKSTVTFASYGTGSPMHLVGERIKRLAGISMVHVPYQGGQGAMVDLLAGRITVGILDAVLSLPQVKAGRLKALAVTGPKRLAALATVPTLTEAGIDFDTVGWHAMFGPASMPSDVRDKIANAVEGILAQSDIKAFIGENGSVPVEPPLSGARWTGEFRTQVQVWGDLVKSTGVSL